VGAGQLPVQVDGCGVREVLAGSLGRKLRQGCTNVKDALELRGMTIEGKDKPTFNLVPSGNHRNQQRVQMQPAPPSGPGQVCPRCKGKLRAWVQTFPTELYTAWTEAAVDSILAKYQPGQFSGPVVVYLWVFGGRGFMESRDWDNVQKCVGDALVAAKVLPVPIDAPALPEGREREGGDDVRSLKGWRTHYLTRTEHVAITGGKVDQVQARLFVQIVDAKAVDPFRI
jgi:hypothetical protein